MCRRERQLDTLIFANAVDMKDNFPQFKPSKIKITIRKVPFWARSFQKFKLFKKAGKIIREKYYAKNVFCDAGRLALLKGMAGEADGEVTYLALGDSTATPDKLDVKLGNELYRRLITLKQASVLTFSSSTFIPSNEGSYAYKEIGLFGGSATTVKDSGSLFTHLAINETKSSSESMTIDYDIIAS